MLPAQQNVICAHKLSSKLQYGLSIRGVQIGSKSDLIEFVQSLERIGLERLFVNWIGSDCMSTAELEIE